MIELPIFYIAVIISVAGLIIATYTDLKQRIVPNKLNYGLAILGLVLFGAQSLIDWTFWPIILSIFGLCFGFLFGWVMWKAGVFAGGDVKLFMGLGALNPLTPILIKTAVFNTATIPLFPITLFIYSLICFLPYGIAVLAYKVYKNKKFQKEILAEMKPKVLEALHAAIFISAAFVIISLIINFTKINFFFATK